MARSTRLSKRWTAAARSVSDGGRDKIRDSSGRPNCGRHARTFGDVASERGAVHAERAVLAEPRRLRPEVVSLAGPLDRRPDGADLALDRPARLIGGRRADLERVAEVEQLHARRTTAEVALAEQRIELHAVEPAVLVALGWCLTRLVVDHDELAVGVELEAVDDAPHAYAAHLGVEHDLDTDRLDRRGIFECEVLTDETLGIVD